MFYMQAALMEGEEGEGGEGEGEEGEGEEGDYAARMQTLRGIGRFLSHVGDYLQKNQG